MNSSEILAKISSKSKEFAHLSIDVRRQIIDEIILASGDFGVSYDIGKAHMESRRIFCDSKDGLGIVGGYGLLTGLITMTYCSCLLKSFDKATIPKIDLKYEFNVDSQITAFDAGTEPQYNIRVIVFSESSNDNFGHFYRNPHDGEVAVILGAGNQPFLSILDTLYQTFVKGRVCIFKHHPLQVQAHRAIEHLLGPLINRGYLISVTNADLSFAQELIYAPEVTAVHLTGGISTHDLIVWGNDGCQMNRRKENKPLLKAAMHSELGAVTPYFVVPSTGTDQEWTDDRISAFASQVVLAFENNCSCNCLAVKVSDL
jgi:hypothetical protein